MRTNKNERYRRREQQMSETSTGRPCMRVVPEAQRFALRPHRLRALVTVALALGMSGCEHVRPYVPPSEGHIVEPPECERAGRRTRHPATRADEQLRAASAAGGQAANLQRGRERSAGERAPQRACARHAPEHRYPSAASGPCQSECDGGDAARDPRTHLASGEHAFSPRRRTRSSCRPTRLS